MATASVTLSLNQSAFLAGMARARSAVSGLGASLASIGTRGVVALGAGMVALGTAAAVGIKKAFDFGGKLADLSAISGKSAREILLLRRALQDAGISMEKIDRYILTGADRGEVIARALKNMSSGDWRDAAASVGKQADILDKNAKTFDRVSDLLGRTGSKLQGFFVGAANAVANSLLPFLEKFDKMDFAGQGERFGAGLLKGAQALTGFFNDPSKLFKVFEDSFTSVILGIGNLLVAVFKKAFTVAQAGAQALFESLMSGKGGGGAGILNSIDSGLIKVFGKNMSGDLNSFGKKLQSQIDTRKAASAGTQGGGIGNRMLEIANETPLEVKDILGAASALGNAQAGISGAIKVGQSILPTPKGATGFGQSAAERAAAGQQKLAESYAAQDLIRSQIATSSWSGGLDVDAFKKRDAERQADFDSRWGTPTPSSAGTGKTKSETFLEHMAKNSDESLELEREAWGTK